MRSLVRWLFATAAVFAAFWILHYPLMRLPYFWDEAGYYVPAAIDFYRHHLLIPQSTPANGHTPLVAIYLGLAWHLFGFSPLVTRSAMILIAAVTVVMTYALGRRVASCEIALWSAALLALCPPFFAQSSLGLVDLAAGLPTTLAVLALSQNRPALFAVAASAAILTKETAAILVPAGGAYIALSAMCAKASSSRTHAEERHVCATPYSWQTWLWLLAPLAPLAAWALYYHHLTGYWTGNAEYLRYNLYSRASPGRFIRILPQRLNQLFIAGFHWLLVAGAAAGFWWDRKRRLRFGNGGAREALGIFAPARSSEAPAHLLREFLFLSFTLVAAYVLMLSLVGGAVLRRYLLPVFPVFILAAVALIWRMPKAAARAFCLGLASCFVASWFINPPWPFPYEDNLAYADFVRLHQQAANFLENQATRARILSAWPATDELKIPALGYVRGPLRVVPVEDFTPEDLDSMSPDSFDIVYLYSRRWRPRDYRPRLKLPKTYLDLAPPEAEESLTAHLHLKLLKSFERRGQWVRIYARGSP